MAILRSKSPATHVNVYQCETWDDFIVSQRKRVGRFAGGHVFRGNAKKDWRLSSQFERWLHRLRGEDESRSISTVFHGREEFTKGRIKLFRHLATGLPGTDTSSLDDEDWLALGRHHGLLTPLLDWTYSPYIAAFFAFTASLAQVNEHFPKGVLIGSFDPNPDPVAIWALALRGELEAEGDFKILGTSRSQLNHWQKAQQGLFTLLTHDIHLDLVSYLASRDHGNSLECYEIPGYEAGKALADLQRMTITFATMFPDFGGAATQANVAGSLEGMGGTGRV